MPPKRRAEKASDPAKKGSSRGSKSSKRGSAEAASESTGLTIVTKLDDNDVLMGRGAMATDYEGNLRLRAIVQSRHEEFNSCTERKRKQEIAQEIIQTVRSKGGRFLQGAETLKGIDPSILPRYEAAWFVVEDNPVLVAKVRQLFRDTKPPPKNSPMRQNEESKQSAVLVTSAVPAGPEGAGMQAPGLNFLWQQNIARPNTTPGSQPSGSGHSSNTAAALQQPRHREGTTTQPDTSSIHETASQSSASVDQHQVAISNSTSQLGHDNAAAVLQSLAAASAPQDQQYDALLALSLASCLQPRQSTAVAASRQPSGPPREERTRSDLRVLANQLLAENQRREREHNLANALLLQLLPQVTTIVSSGAAAAAPAPPPPPPPQQQDPSMTWLFQQLQALNQQGSAAVAVAAAPPAAPPPVPSIAAPPPAQAFPDLNALLRGEQSAPRESGLLQQPNRMVELERLLLPSSQWRLTTGGGNAGSFGQASGTTTRGGGVAGNPEDGLALLLRSLQRQYFPPPPHPPS